MAKRTTKTTKKKVAKASKKSAKRTAATATARAKKKTVKVKSAGTKTNVASRTTKLKKKSGSASRAKPKKAAESRPVAVKKKAKRGKTTGTNRKVATDRKAASPSTRAPSRETTEGSLSATSQDPIQFPQDRPLPKTHLTAKELREFKELLLAKRSELAGDVLRLSNEALSNDARGQGEQSAMPIHMADVGSDNWEQEFTLGLLANEEAIVREIDEALERIQHKTYGVCLATHGKISHARLRAKPWAQYCIEYARAREEGRAL